MQALVSQEANLTSCQGQYTQLESSITQRLKWAAGANPSLNLILQQFDDASVLRKQLAEVGLVMGLLFSYWGEKRVLRTVNWVLFAMLIFSLLFATQATHNNHEYFPALNLAILAFTRCKF